MTITENEFLRMTPFKDSNGKRAVDLRVWKRTPTGGMPTKASIVIDQRMIIPMIIQLQKIHQHESELQTTESTKG